ncbi:hypothetical protein PFL603g_02922 [Pseudomonas fluorescens]|uniref:Uncharacterized protein n=1 Tax=Pseudomonas fluorescens TaxID=294 RepID=A0A120FZ26_PSEFL|nr:hypothetical protein PFL603g_02922 [Pseudomonas fluorescens]
MFVRFACLIKWIHVVDYRANLVLVHSVKCRAWSNGYAANRCLPENHRHQVQGRGLACQKADLCDTSTCLCCSNRLIDAVTACHVQQEIHSLAVSELQNVLCPLRGSVIIYTRNSAQFFYSLQIFITAGGNDNLGSQSCSNLCCKNRNTSRSLNQDGLPPHQDGRVQDVFGRRLR